jgi:hypothetical protein
MALLEVFLGSFSWKFSWKFSDGLLDGLLRGYFDDLFDVRSAGSAGWPPGRLAAKIQIWHLSMQMAQKTCRFKGKTFAAGDLSPCTGNMILRQNGFFASRPAGFPRFHDQRD